MNRPYSLLVIGLLAIAALCVASCRTYGDELSDKTLIAQLAAENYQLRQRIAQLEATLSAPAPVAAGACGQAASACGASASGCGQSMGVSRPRLFGRFFGRSASACQ